ncbi:MAG TPA: hypothetical protein EYQ20_22160 [candidate division Zixibacteria bacterium]|nr:hypothetical protein [candidate division Zixibacteria bacterium]
MNRRNPSAPISHLPLLTLDDYDVQSEFGMATDARFLIKSMTKPGSYSWAGLYNTHFWGDRKQGIAVVLMTQALPSYDDRCIQLPMDIEKRIYRNLD